MPKRGCAKENERRMACGAVHPRVCPGGVVKVKRCRVACEKKICRTAATAQTATTTVTEPATTTVTEPATTTVTEPATQPTLPPSTPVTEPATQPTLPPSTQPEPNLQRSGATLPPSTQQRSGAGCSLIGDVQFRIDLPAAGPEKPRESHIIEMDLRLFDGDVLPVNSFNLDDIAFMVYADYDVDANYSFSNNTRNITVPPEALLLVDGNNPNLADGRVDHRSSDTRYIYKDQSHFMSRKRLLTTSDELMKLNGIGIPFQKHNEISISKLSELGFITNDILRFKIIHVAHGWGYINMNMSIPVCKDE